MPLRFNHLRQPAAALSQIACLLALCFLCSCVKLYEPPRYTRLTIPAGAPSLHVLMIGNSLTYYNDLPGLLQQLSAREPAPIQFATITFPYASLKFHWNGGKAQAKIHSQHWDYVILQEFSNLPVTDPATSIKYFKLFDAEVRSAGAKTIISQNWTRRDRQNDYSPMLDTYLNVQQQTHATLAPVGAAWRDCELTEHNIHLRADDRHPSDAGTYLAACVLFDVLYHKDPVELPMDLNGPHLPPDQVKTMREIAGKTVAGFQINQPGSLNQ